MTTALDLAMAEYDERIDRQLEDAHGYHDTMRRLSDADIDVSAEGTTDDPDDPYGVGDVEEDKVSAAIRALSGPSASSAAPVSELPEPAPEPAPPRSRFSRRSRRVRAPNAGRLVLSLTLPSLPFLTSLVVTRRARPASVVVFRLDVQPNQPERSMSLRLPAGAYVVSLSRVISGGAARLNTAHPGAMIDLRPSPRN